MHNLGEHGENGYGLTVVSNEIPMTGLYEAELTFWGVPGASSHDLQRGLACNDTRVDGRGYGVFQECENSRGETLDIGSHGQENEGFPVPVPSESTPKPFLTLPTDCAAPAAKTTFRADSWEEPGSYTEATATMPAVTNCGALTFDPSIEAKPDTLLADEPVGLDVNLIVPQEEGPSSDATPQLRNAEVTLPEGLSINPGVVGGIEACNASGPEGLNMTGPESEEPGADGELQLAPGHCPNASTIGTAEAITPLLPEPVKGHVYLAAPGCGQTGERACTEEDALDGNLYKLYLELGGQGPLASSGVNIKVPGEVEANPATGQLTTKFLENPQLPFSELKVHLNGGPRASLANPPSCGAATTRTVLTPWSAAGVGAEGILIAGGSDATPISSFGVEDCQAPVGLRPQFTAGTTRPQAGSFTTFTLNLTRQDREQYLSALQIHTPPGLLGMLSSVPLCGEPMAAEGTCSEASRIGTTTVASGAGSSPFEVSGRVYLTSGYKGAPFGLSVVTDVVAGPFNLGRVVVRAQIDVSPTTSTLTVTSDPLPQLVFGVPLRLKRLTVTIDRPGFMLNPTNCAAQTVNGTISGSLGAIAHVSSQFAAADCRALSFDPKFSASTSAKTSRALGASLNVELSYPSGAQGTQANVKSVKVELPKSLPSRLTTLQKACTAKVFEANPASCPSQSVIGHAVVHTQVLPVRLEGPAYFVSHGGEAFPSLEVVLQGYGVTVELVGDTFISKAGITSSTFRSTPDVPFESFELTLPQGRYSALTANGNLCKRAGRLEMPTEFVGQNDAVVRRSISIKVTECAKAKAKARKRAHRHGKVSRRSRK